MKLLICIALSHPSFAFFCVWSPVSFAAQFQRPGNTFCPWWAVGWVCFTQITHLHKGSRRAVSPTAACQPSPVISSCDPGSPCSFCARSYGSTEDTDLLTGCYQLLYTARISEKVLEPSNETCFSKWLGTSELNASLQASLGGNRWYMTITMHREQLLGCNWK